MALIIKLTPGYVYADNELDTAAKRNALGNPTIALEGSIGTLALADNSVTTPKLADNVLSADAVGRAKMQDGFLSADATGRAKMQDGFVTAVKAEETFRAGVQQYFATASASGTAYLISLNPAATGYTAGMRVVFLADVANTGVVTLNVNGLGAQTLKAYGTQDLAAGRIGAGQIIEAIYDGTNFQLVSEARRFDVGETTISVGVPVALAHGLGRTPGVVGFALRCKTAEFGYAVGDEIATPAVFQGGANATNVFLICSSTVSINTFRKDTAAACSLTAGNWKIVGYARL